ncbi:MAG: N-acetylmuramoyl-L-alanine amidase [Bacteroidales bacterium]
MKTIQYLVIHCTATPAGREVSSADIRRWHLSPPPVGRGWKQVGYTDMIHLDGSIERLAGNNDDNIVDSWEITNGVAGMNSTSRHIVYVGGLKGDTRTPQQKDALREYVKSFLEKYPNVKVAGHNQFAAKDCPSFNVPMWLKSIGVNDKNILK